MGQEKKPEEKPKIDATKLGESVIKRLNEIKEEFNIENIIMGHVPINRNMYPRTEVIMYSDGIDFIHKDRDDGHTIHGVLYFKPLNCQFTYTNYKIKD